MTAAMVGTIPCKKKKEFKFYLRMSQLCKSVQYACRSKTFLRVDTKN